MCSSFSDYNKHDTVKDCQNHGRTGGISKKIKVHTHKNNKGQELQNYKGKSYHSCAMRFSSIRYFTLTSFKLIFLLLYKLWSGQKLTMKYNNNSNCKKGRVIILVHYTPTHG